MKRLPESQPKHAAILPCLVAALLLACGESTYWERDMPEGWQAEEIRIRFVDDPTPFCGPVRGCAHRSPASTQVLVYVKRGLPKDEKLCVIGHEARHGLGDGHPQFNDRTHYGTDCGDGRVL